jgi:hypothetical protein
LKQQKNAAKKGRCPQRTVVLFLVGNKPANSLTAEPHQKKNQKTAFFLVFVSAAHRKLKFFFFFFPFVLFCFTNTNGLKKNLVLNDHEIQCYTAKAPVAFALKRNKEFPSKKYK